MVCEGALYRTGKWKAGCLAQTLGETVTALLDVLRSQPDSAPGVIREHVRNCAACSLELLDFEEFCNRFAEGDHTVSDGPGAALLPTFNLLDRPWIPCVRSDGGLLDLSLRETLVRAAEIREIHDGSPLVIAALHRLLLAVLHSALRGPKDPAEWKTIYEAGTFDRPWLHAYLEDWHGRFDLFDPKHPFFQVSGLQHLPVEPNKLAHELASGNNATLFDHTADESSGAIPASEAARRLIAFLGYAMGGLTSRLPGEPPSAKAAPLVAGVSILVRGASLFETLALNLLVYDPSRGKPIPGESDDRPAWEVPARSTREERVPLGWLDWLTWPSRRVYLIARNGSPAPLITRVQLAGGTELPDGFAIREPWFALRRWAQGLAALRFDPERALWRDSTALFRVGSEDEQPPRAAEQVQEHVSSGVLPRDRVLSYDLLGFANEQAKVLLWRREGLALPVGLLGDSAALEDLQTGLGEAQAVREALWGALAHAAEIALAPASDAKTGRKPLRKDVSSIVRSFQAEATYWGRLAVDFEAFLPALGTDHAAALLAWRHALSDSATAAFERAREALGSHASGLKAQALGDRRLMKGLREALPAIFPLREPAAAAPASSPDPGAPS